MNEKQVELLKDYINQRLRIQKQLLEKSKDDQYHMGAIMELMGVEERLLLLLKPQP
jgi:hypothetical protein